MEDLNVKTGNLNPATAAPTFKDGDKDGGSSPANALALAFNQFLRKAAANPDRLLGGARGQVIPFTFAAGADRVANRPDHAGFERADKPMSRASADPAPAAPHDEPRSSSERGPESAGTPAPQSRESAAPAPAPAANASRGERTDSSSSDTKDNGEVRRAQPKGQAAQSKGQAPESVDGDDRGRSRKKKSVASPAKENTNAPKEQAMIVLTGLIALAKPGEAEERADGGADAPAEQANDTADENHRMAGIANALSQLAKQPRGLARSGSNQDAKDNQAAASGGPGNDATEADKAATKKAGSPGDIRARQAADLAERIGSETRVSVEVTVNDDAKTLMSRPMASLISVHDEKNTGAALARLGVIGQTDGTGEQALSATTQAEAADAVAARLAAISGMGGLNSASLASAEADEPTLQITLPGVATGSGSATRALDAPGQANAAQNAQKPAASFRAEVLEQVSVTIQKAIKDGTDRITVQLRPAELGRIDVRIEVAGDGRTLVHVTADRADTLDLLQRDARDLARGLQDAGLRADAGNLQFSLREQTAEHRERRASGGAAGGSTSLDGVAAEAESAPAWTPTVRPGRVDIRA